jgi:hypothetical protein
VLGIGDDAGSFRSSVATVPARAVGAHLIFNARPWGRRAPQLSTTLCIAIAIVVFNDRRGTNAAIRPCCNDGFDDRLVC